MHWVNCINCFASINVLAHIVLTESSWSVVWSLTLVCKGINISRFLPIPSNSQADTPTRTWAGLFALSVLSVLLFVAVCCLNNVAVIILENSCTALLYDASVPWQITDALKPDHSHSLTSLDMAAAHCSLVVVDGNIVLTGKVCEATVSSFGLMA